MHTTLKILFVAALFTACQNQTTAPSAAPTSDASAILKHKYWISKPFHDALFANQVVDTLGYMNCMELVFFKKDTLLLTSCMSDALDGTYVATGNNLEIRFNGLDSVKTMAKFDETSGILSLTLPDGWAGDGKPVLFIPKDGVSIDFDATNPTIALSRKRMAGNYTLLPEKGQAAITALMELHEDGTQVGLGNYNVWEPYPAGVGSCTILDKPRNVMYLYNKGQEMDQTAMAWQISGDTLRLWNTKNISPEGDMPEYKVTSLKGTYLKAK